MRVAYVCADPGVPVFGSKGASVHVQAVVGQLLARGAEVHLLTPRTGGDPPASVGLTVHHRGYGGGRDAAAREAAARCWDSEVSDDLDRLHAAGPLDLVYERYSLWGRSASAWSRRTRVRHVLEVNAPLPDEQVRHRSMTDRAAADQVARCVMRDAGVVVCVSDGVARWVRRQGARPGRVHTVPNGVDTRRIQPAAFRRDPQPFTVGFLGTLKPWHGVGDLVDAMALLHRQQPGYHLLVVGDGPERASLEQRSVNVGLAGVVEFAGQVGADQVSSLLGRMDVGVAPYPVLADFYFSPLKIYEYLAAGLPVVATDVGDIERLVDGSVGVVVRPGDPRSLAAAVAGLRSDPARRAGMAECGRREAESEHDWQHVVSTVLELATVPRVSASTVPGQRAGGVHVGT